MSALILRNRFQGNTTLIENEFIDNYMAAANGEYVKVYLLLLRHLNNPCVSLSIPYMADYLENTEGDIVRALKYWEKEGLMTLEYDEQRNVVGVEVGRIPGQSPASSHAVPDSQAISGSDAYHSGSDAHHSGSDAHCSGSDAHRSGSDAHRSGSDSIRFRQMDVSSAVNAMTDRDKRTLNLSSGVPMDQSERPTDGYPCANGDADVSGFGSSRAELSARSREAVNRKELKQILFVAEQYMGKPLSHTEMESITYFYETLGFSADLIDYLIEYCVENGHRSMAYIQKVALAWADAHITTVEQAKGTSALYNKTCYSILNAYGIKGRGPATPELVFIRRWTETWVFDLEIILEAISRTMKAIHQPSFEYTDRILENWHSQKVHTLNDIRVLDTAFTKDKTSARKSAQQNRQSQPSAAKSTQFEEHTYNMDELTRNLLQNSN